MFSIRSQGLIGAACGRLRAMRAEASCACAYTPQSAYDALWGEFGREGVLPPGGQNLKRWRRSQALLMNTDPAAPMSMDEIWTRIRCPGGIQNGDVSITPPWRATADAPDGTSGKPIGRC